jgi:hypothetical protein
MGPTHIVAPEQGKQQAGIELGSGEIGTGIHCWQEGCDPTGLAGDGRLDSRGEGRALRGSGCADGEEVVDCVWSISGGKAVEPGNDLAGRN